MVAEFGSSNVGQAGHNKNWSSIQTNIGKVSDHGPCCEHGLYHHKMALITSGCDQIQLLNEFIGTFYLCFVISMAASAPATAASAGSSSALANPLSTAGPLGTFPSYGSQSVPERRCLRPLLWGLRSRRGQSGQCAAGPAGDRFGACCRSLCRRARELPIIVVMMAVSMSIVVVTTVMSVIVITTTVTGTAMPADLRRALQPSRQHRALHQGRAGQPPARRDHTLHGRTDRRRLCRGCLRGRPRRQRTPSGFDRGGRGRLQQGRRRGGASVAPAHQRDSDQLRAEG